ncbi:MAG TPA: hypothetical protein PK413_06590, partial [Thermoanaerobaculia bacterium]|nr:hypothetical protein [Thermoanaerobaculia bacterium]
MPSRPHCLAHWPSLLLSSALLALFSPAQLLAGGGCPDHPLPGMASYETASGGQASHGKAAGKDPKADAKAEAPKWDVNVPPAGIPTSEVELDVREGTWLSLDVSPDGKEVAFDLLGDLYTVPISGGEAHSLTSGMAWDMQPRYSPNGKWIAFTSDRA